ncbi:nucleoside kinase [Tissierella creatinophila]|uniref:Threonine--tRNA ligase n=1 Tax=Tissierella creatinophila DSM 6911 TaxID=1123403 RepID=A0A1U7M9B7_TISCR|nr:nucleoside kinase [Tissierella creatinophila]OLS03798.1 threonine--tRNA ligase [Tissierella creatinophila DSM 6911]
MKVKVNIVGLKYLEVEKGISLLELSKNIFGENYKKYLGARINNTIYNLDKSIEENVDIEFLDNTDVDGYRIYTKTISVVFIMACKELYPNSKVSIEYFLGSGLYAKLDEDYPISFDDLINIEQKMREIVEKDSIIERIKYKKHKAIEIFRRNGYADKLRLLESIDKEEISIYKIENHYDSFHGYLAASTGYVKEFKLKYYYPGVIILFPSKKNNYNIDNFKEQKKLAKMFEDTSDWLDILDLSYVGSLNEKINNGNIDDIIQITEAHHEKKVAEIADIIYKDTDVNIIQIAGPSSSGKTTFSKRLAVQMNVNGQRPVTISLDDYFLDRDNTPLKKDGLPDFETIKAIDLESLNMDLVNLLEGRDVELPKFNFLTGKRENSGKIVRLDKNHPIIIEGIHGLNPELTKTIPEKNKFKIYISALTQLNLDPHNRISTTDIRLIRRMVRDFKFRGNGPLKTLELWTGVREGEEKYIFPYQEEADIMFNSSLVYEMGVLKKHIIPLLKKIDKSNIYYSEAIKLIKFLEYFSDIEKQDTIPPNSILREFIGGASFKLY